MFALTINTDISRCLHEIKSIIQLNMSPMFIEPQPHSFHNICKNGLYSQGTVSNSWADFASAQNVYIW